MTTSINTNTSALYAQNNLRSAGASAQSSIARLSSGNKIVRASDDVAALSIGTILRTDVGTLKAALSNASQGNTLLQVADGALSRIGEILQRQKALTSQAQSGTLGATERGYLNQEFQALALELDRIADSTNFNGVKLINGNLTGGASGNQVAQEATAAAVTAAITTVGDTIDTTVLTGGAAAFAVSNNGTTADNSTLPKLLGSLENASVTLVADTGAQTATVVVNINGVNFASADQGADFSAIINNLALTATDGSGVIITLDIADQSGNISASITAGEATTIENNIETELRKLSIYQAKAISATDGDAGAITTELNAGTVLAGFTGAGLVVNAKDGFTSDPATNTLEDDTVFKQLAPGLSNFKIDVISTTQATFSIDVNGTTYYAKKATIDTDLTTAGHDFGTDPDGNDVSPSAGLIKLFNLDDLNSYVTIDFGSMVDGLNVSVQDYADKFAEAFNKMLNGGSQGGATFAIGTDSSDTISVSIDSVKTNSLYKNAGDDLIDLNVTTTTDAKTASDVLDLAIQKVTAVRADVGALQSRFGYASATLETSIQNLDAARGQFLDADISEESTNFAKNQVLIQASISVLAQANQLPQNLLKLIG